MLHVKISEEFKIDNPMIFLRRFQNQREIVDNSLEKFLISKIHFWTCKLFKTILKSFSTIFGSTHFENVLNRMEPIFEFFSENPSKRATNNDFFQNHKST